MTRTVLLLSLLLVAAAATHSAERADAQAQQIEVLDPRGIWPDVERVPLSKRPADLRNKTVYIVNSWEIGRSGFSKAVERLSRRLETKFPGVVVRVTDRNTSYAEDDPALWKQMQAEADAFVYVGAPSSSTTAYAFRWSAHLERMGIPGAVLMYDTLLSVADSTRAREAAPLRYTAIAYPVETLSEDQLDAAIERVVRTLTDPLTQDEQRTGKAVRAQPPAVFFRGTEDEVQRYFREQGLTDGLPVIAPTRSRVDAMLKGTSRKPDEVISTMMPPEELTVTVEKVAIVGVMAGCDPSHFPVLLASLEAFLKLNRNAVIRSTNSFGFMQVVNGPIRKQLGMNSGTHLLGPGNYANSTIGRALRLFQINLGGGVPGTNMMAVIGSLATWPFLYAEDEETSPWEPLSVTRGFAPQENTLTMYFGGWSHAGNYGHVRFDLRHVAEDLAEFEYTRGAAVIISPKRAELLAAAGMSKQDVQNYLLEHAKKPLGSLRTSSYFEETSATRELADDAVVSVYAPGTIDIIVAGGDASPMMQAWHMARPVTVSIDAWR